MPYSKALKNDHGYSWLFCAREAKYKAKTCRNISVHNYTPS